MHVSDNCQSSKCNISSICPTAVKKSAQVVSFYHSPLFFLFARFSFPLSSFDFDFISFSYPANVRLASDSLSSTMNVKQLTDGHEKRGGEGEIIG